MRVIWEVQDGYVGKSRPQFTEISDDELEGLDEKERKSLIEEYVQEDFEQNITWGITNYED